MSTPSSPQCGSIPPDQTITFPLESLTETQYDVFTRYINATKKEGKGIREPIWLTLVLAGEKPATELSDFNDHSDFSITAKEIAEAFDLAYHQHFEHSLDVARTSWRLDLLPTTGQGVTAAAFYRRMGCFFGYSEEDVEHFIETTGWDIHPTELVEKGVFQAEEAAYTVFLPQRYDPASGHEQAIESGKRIREIVTDCAARWNFSYLDEHADWIYHDAVKRFTS